MMIAVAGGILTLISAVLLYLASPNQPFLAGTRRSRALVPAGAIGMVVGLGLILQWAGSATSVFITLTLAMLVWTVVPLGVAWWRGTPEDRK